MAITGENQITQNKTCPNAVLPTINLTWTVPEHNPVLHGQKPATSLLGYPSDVPKQSAYTHIPGLSCLQWLWCCKIPLLHNQTTAPWFFRTAPTYFYTEVHTCFDVVFSGQWIGNERHIPRPQDHQICIFKFSNLDTSTGRDVCSCDAYSPPWAAVSPTVAIKNVDSDTQRRIWIVFPCILHVVSCLSLSEISQCFIKIVKYVLSGSVFPQPISIKGSSGT